MNRRLCHRALRHAFMLEGLIHEVSRPPSDRNPDPTTPRSSGPCSTQDKSETEPSLPGRPVAQGRGSRRCWGLALLVFSSQEAQGSGAHGLFGRDSWQRPTTAPPPPTSSRTGTRAAIGAMARARTSRRTRRWGRSSRTCCALSAREGRAYPQPSQLTARSHVGPTRPTSSGTKPNFRAGECGLRR
jgi:hypothetical protein